MKEIEGDLIELAKQGNFDIIAHGCNCFCTMGTGVAKQIKNHFTQAYIEDERTKKGDINKLGNYTKYMFDLNNDDNSLEMVTLLVINIYSQYHWNGKNPIDYEALALALRKINFNYKGKTIGLPKIGAGRAGGDWNKIKQIIRTELKDMDVIIIYFDGDDQYK